LNVVIDPNFARWLFVLKRLRQPGLNLRDLPPMDLVLVTHAHFDHLHRQSLRAIARQTRRQTGTAPTLVVPHHLFDLVDDLGRRLSPELALLPIGAYNPPQFRNVHTSPADATQAFLDLKARWMVPMHYGTFRLSHEPLEEPLQLLDRAARKAGVKDKVVVLEEGVTRFF